MTVKVVVDVLNSNVNKLYSYLLKEGETCKIGCEVLVNFAGRNLTGIVLETSEDEVSQIKLKQVLRVVSKVPVLNDELIQLFWRLAKDNHMLYADILRLLYPGKMRNNRVKHKTIDLLSLNPEFNETLIKRAKKQLEVLDFFKDQTEYFTIAKPELLTMFSSAAVLSLIEKGALRPESIKVNRTPYSIAEEADCQVQLTSDQMTVAGCITGADNSKFLIHGVTGSGKTEVYMAIISNSLGCGKTALMLVPEIALTPQVFRLFKNRFGDNVAIIHSGLSDGERFDEWNRIRGGEAKIVVGARSAIFSPLENIGVIIIDEEHEQTYVPDGSKYTTLDVARFRCDYNSANLVLGSATPSVETYNMAMQGEFKLLELSSRINKRPLPKVHIEDMRIELKNGNNSFMSARLKEALDECLKNNNQAILFINRRGYSSLVMCAECGYVAKCKDCDVSLTYHKEDDMLKCHYCGNRYKMLDVCPECGSEYIKQKGIGTEKVVGELQKMYPSVNILRMDNDTTSTKQSHQRIVEDFAHKKANILVGTQMITKGHDFKDVSLVGILDADLSLYFSDYRSVERTFQLITQVSGRAGRAGIEGLVVLQTYTPKHYVYKYAANYDYKGFFEREITLRKATNYPPFATILRVVFSSESEDSLIENLKGVYLRLTKLKAENEQDIIYMNKMKSPIKRLQRKFRYQILLRIKNGNAKLIIDKIYSIVEDNRSGKVASYVEVNPNNMF